MTIVGDRQTEHSGRSMQLYWQSWDVLCRSLFKAQIVSHECLVAIIIKQIC